ncbi:MAG: GntR family transcriptional regulator [Devosia sp.]
MSTDAAAPLPPSTTRSLSQVQQAHQRIEHLIITLVLPPGEIVTEAGIANLLNIGRTPVREALQHLAREGLVVILPKRGILVSSIDIRRQLRLLEFRRVIAGFVVRAAAERSTAAERTAFADYAARFEAVARSRDAESFHALDDGFASALTDCARNEFASNALRQTHALCRRFIHAFDRDGEMLQRNAENQAALAQALSTGQAEAALARLTALLDAVEAFTRATLDRP